MKRFSSDALRNAESVLYLGIIISLTVFNKAISQNVTGMKKKWNSMESAHTEMNSRCICPIEKKSLKYAEMLCYDVMMLDKPSTLFTYSASRKLF